MNRSFRYKLSVTCISAVYFLWLLQFLIPIKWLSKPDWPKLKKNSFYRLFEQKFIVKNFTWFSHEFQENKLHTKLQLRHKIKIKLSDASTGGIANYKYINFIQHRLPKCSVLFIFFLYNGCFDLLIHKCLNLFVKFICIFHTT